MSISNNDAWDANSVANKARESAILEQYSKNDQCVYYGIINNRSSDDEPLVKFGNSNDLCARVNAHRKIYDGFCLINAFRVQNKMQVENAMKEHPVLNNYRRKIEIRGKHYTEVLSLNHISFAELNKIIKAVICGVKFSTANYRKLLEENEELKVQVATLTETIETASAEKPEYFHCEKCEYITSVKGDYNRHLLSRKHSNRENNVDESDNKEYICKICNYITAYKKDYNRHLLCKKHEKQTLIAINKLKLHQCLSCNKTYSSNKNLWKHKQKCKKPSQNVNDVENKNDNEPIPKASEITSELLIEVFNQNKELRTILTEQHNVR